MQQVFTIDTCKESLLQLLEKQEAWTQNICDLVFVLYPWPVQIDIELHS